MNSNSTVRQASMIRTIGKRLFDSIKNEKFKNTLLQAIPFWLASVITGIVAVLYARAFLYSEKLTLIVMHYNRWLLFILTPVCFVCSWWIIKKVAFYAKGSGIPQVMASIDLATPGNYSLVDKLLSARIIVVKVISSIVMVIGGGIIGREGPTIQVAASVFKITNNVLPAWWPKISKKNVLVAGAASGLAAAFNTPLGGIVFAIEELSKTHINQFKSALFTAVIIAGLTAQGLAGPYLYLGYPDLRNLTASVFIGVLLIAVIAGLAGAATGKLLFMGVNRMAAIKKLRKQFLLVLSFSLIVASLGFFFGEDALGSGKEIMTRTLFTNDKLLHWYTPFVRMGGMFFSFISGSAGGIFAPSLSAGAGIGSVIAGWFHTSSSETNLLILSGMVAFLTGITRSPFTCAILVLEMTDRHNVIFHLMLAGMLANLIASVMDRHSVYEHLKENYLHDLLKPAG